MYFSFDVVVLALPTFSPLALPQLALPQLGPTAASATHAWDGHVDSSPLFELVASNILFGKKESASRVIV
jgi:hypothetical protein